MASRERTMCQRGRLSLQLAAVDDLVDELIEQFHLAQGEFVKGNPEPVKRLLSHREDLTLNNPISPPARGNRLLGLWSVQHRSSEVASSLAPRS